MAAAALPLLTLAAPSSARPQQRALRSRSAPPPRSLRRLKCKALESDRKQVYEGVYGPWSIEQSDVQEVLLYRAGLVTCAVAFVAAASPAFLPDEVAGLLVAKQDALYSVGAASLGLSLLLIHIYVTPLKRALQVLWAIGIAGSLFVSIRLASPADQSLVSYVADNPACVWTVGPLFAALTGLVFKEGLCYGKLEAAALFLVIPSLLLGHLSGLADAGVEKVLLAAWMLLFAVFAARKFTQPIKDDIGDKSIFMFNALPQDKREAILRSKQEQE